MAKKVGRTAKKLPKGCLGFVDKKGKAKCVPMRWKKVRSRRRQDLGGDVIKKRKGYLYFLKKTRGKGMLMMEAKMNRKGRKRKRGAKKRGRKVKARRVRRRGRKRGRPSRKRCPKFRSARTVRAAKACVSRGKGRTKRSKLVYNAAVRRLRKSKAGKVWCRKNKITLAKVR